MEIALAFTGPCKKKQAARDLREVRERQRCDRLERTNRELMPKLESKGIKFRGGHYTLGRYDVVVLEAAMWLARQVFDRASSETLVAIKRGDVLKFLE